MSELKSLNDAFVETILIDSTLLTKPGELIQKLEPLLIKDTSNMRSFQTLQKALNLNIGENILAAIEDEERLTEEFKNAKRTLQQTGMQDGRIEDVLNLIKNAIYAVKTKEQEKIAAAETEVLSTSENVEEKSTEDYWFCQNCGAKNTGKFCKMCGTSKEGIQRHTNIQTSTSVNSADNAEQSADPQYNSHTESKKPLSGAKIAIIAVIGTLLAGFAIQSIIGKSKNIANNQPQTASVQEQKSDKKVEEKKVETKKEKLVPKPASAPSELAFGEIFIGQSENEVRRILGSPNSITTPNSQEHRHFEYNDMTVVVTHGKVTGFISDSNRYASKRGVYPGLPQADVINKYGKSEHAFKTDGYDIIMEYPFNSEDNRPCLLRFAIKNGVVNYVSARIWSEEEERREKRSQEKAQQAFINYHTLITRRDFNGAFNTFSKERKARYKNSVQNFSQGYSATLSSEVVYMSLNYINDNEASFDYVLVARDRANGGVIRQEFEGKVVLVFEDGSWKIAETESRKIREEME